MERSRCCIGCIGCIGACIRFKCAEPSILHIGLLASYHYAVSPTVYKANMQCCVYTPMLPHLSECLVVSLILM